MFIDTHAHLNDKAFIKDLETVINGAVGAGVERIINVGYDLSSSRIALDIAKKYPQLYAAVGIHPHDAKAAPKDYLDRIQSLSQEPKVVAIGEMGLDFYRNLSPPNIQKEVFIGQLELAIKLNKPFIIHDREAHVEILSILKEKGKNVQGVLHCFSGSKEMAIECVKMGYYISIAGPVTYKNAKKLLEVSLEVPLDRLLIETDCPYLTPEPFTGGRNEPSLVVEVAKKIAAIRGVGIEIIAKATTENAYRLFDGLK